MLPRSLRQGLRPLLLEARGITTSPIAAAAPALQSAVSSGGGFLSKLFGGGSTRVKTPLTEPLPGVVFPTPIPPPAERPTCEITTLPNGVKICSEATPGPTATLGLYVDSGSVYESHADSGASHLLEYLAFRATQNRTHFRLVREVENIGGHFLASASREQMAYNIDVVRECVPEALELLTDAVLNPKFNPWEVEEQAARLREDLKNLKDNPQSLLLEGLHQTAYTGGLGRPLFATEDALSRLTPAVLADFVARNYGAPRVLLAAAGVEHQALVGLSTPLLSGVPQGAPAGVKSEYVGGDFRQHAPLPVTHFLLGFEMKGGWKDIKASVAVTVLQYLMGGGAFFSAGGPGKGMHSRLYTNIMNQYEFFHTASAFNSIYNETGLVGVYAAVESNKLQQGVDIVVKQLHDVTGSIPDEQVERAKKSAISAVLTNLESRAIVAEDIGRQVLTYGHRKPPAEFIALVNQLTSKDLSDAAKALLKTPLSLAVYGDLSAAPRYDTVAKKFQ